MIVSIDEGDSVTISSSSWLSLLTDPGAKQDKVLVEVGLGILEVLVGGATSISRVSGTKSNCILSSAVSRQHYPENAFIFAYGL